ncbi:helix-turn-helix transcriptional regulator [Paraburkholderia caballeronis]|uniref:DNA-binding transcriptional regulator, CsgD family n=1 Tax=Paraburkholderia caballeronis TaxID=416943 RepID=A0A1H7NVT9_9BURK|nr:helix-turn-helix transcriptional regulator [Paraburkholderia caballeronis]PXW25507.1 LuxR family transcriptional regulator [Paraburkholderia caballeronis]PXX01114.1 LuxR family transcriptional regulator [Paraburkholderia caballeronis]RAJ99533.1 LuxR family transcriptional regulator [Paraburkholderia caballeronis]SEE34650.1 transcriptional regulator, LuxR family [Paraburkholderia caballeronis]SEL27642.1 DNA-binding transcriptional regulator, CsgD family [Paraburkholderia caballeronis]
MRHWRLDRPQPAGQFDLSRVTGLVGAIGHDDANALASEVLHALGPATSVSQCTIFAYEFGNRPRTVSVADHRGGRFLRDVADTYARLFYVLDGNQQIVTAAPADRPDPSLVLHWQTSADIAHEGYRNAWYSQPDVSDRLSLLLQPAADIWLSVNLYRVRDAGNFLPGEIEFVETLAPLIGHAARHHYALRGQSQMGIPQMMLARLRGLCPDLSKRELDALRGVLEGHTAAEIAERMGVKPSSVVTYQKRAYQRLGISSQRQLFALCVS